MKTQTMPIANLNPSVILSIQNTRKANVHRPTFSSLVELRCELMVAVIGSVTNAGLE